MIDIVLPIVGIFASWGLGVWIGWSLGFGSGFDNGYAAGRLEERKNWEGVRTGRAGKRASKRIREDADQKLARIPIQDPDGGRRGD